MRNRREVIDMKFKDIVELSNYLDVKDVFRIFNLDDLDSWVKNMEMKIRSSTEYTFWRHRIKNEKKEQTCSILGLDVSKLEYTKIDYHHIIYLWYIVIITGKYLLNNLPEEKDYITTWDVVSLVLEDHLDDIIPYTPLTITSHQQHHDGLVNIPKEKILGDYEKWLEKYEREINEVKIIKEHIETVLYL